MQASFEEFSPGFIPGIMSTDVLPRQVDNPHNCGTSEAIPGVHAARETNGANSTTVNMKAERATEVSAPTAIVYPHNKAAAIVA